MPSRNVLFIIFISVASLRVNHKPAITGDENCTSRRKLFDGNMQIFVRFNGWLLLGHKKCTFLLKIDEDYLESPSIRHLHHHKINDVIPVWFWWRIWVLWPWRWMHRIQRRKTNWKIIKMNFLLLARNKLRIQLQFAAQTLYKQFILPSSGQSLQHIKGSFDWANPIRN